MSKENESILLKGNEYISAGNYEGFLEFCTEDTVWEFIGEQTLKGKTAVRSYMTENYIMPPKFHVKTLVAQNDYVTAVGEIEIKDKDGKWNKYSYCDVWRFSEGKMAELNAFVIEKKN